MGITLRLIQLLEHDQEDMKREAILALTELIQNHDTNMGIAISNNGRLFGKFRPIAI